jgi:Fe-S cluster biogenesis protein NfuA
MSHDKLRSAVEAELEKIRPYLAIDNGGVEYVRFEAETRTLELRLTGNCAICPLSMMTLRAGIERFILAALPEVRRIEKVT